MEIVIAVMVLAALFSIPYMVGRKVDSPRWGCGVLSVIPVAIAALGVVGVILSRDSTDGQAEGWAMLSAFVLFVLAVMVLGFLGLGWLNGRAMRQRSASRSDSILTGPLNRQPWEQCAHCNSLVRPNSEQCPHCGAAIVGAVPTSGEVVAW